MKSFVKGADHSFFPLQNLPYGVFRREDEKAPRIGVAIGDHVLDLAHLEAAGLLPIEKNKTLFAKEFLNDFAAEGEKVWKKVRERLQALLGIDNTELQNNEKLLSKALLPQNKVTMQMPFSIGGFSDFYASEQHATNVGKLFRPNDNPLLPNWKYLPVAYNGRASTVFLSGTHIPRPMGQIKLPNQESPLFSACRKLDFELEMGIFVGVGNPQGERISIDQARSHIFGLTLLNDWSARDIQAFEYQPLGPFLSKSFATSISPWVVTLDALKAFMQPLPKQIPETVDYLKQAQPELPNVKLQIEIKPRGASQSTMISETAYPEIYWSMEQMLAHHTVNHCILKPGDLLGTGTISGKNRENVGCLLEMTLNGKEPIKLVNGEERTFLEDGDTVIFTGYCEAKDYKIGFGALEGTVSGVK